MKRHEALEAQGFTYYSVEYADGIDKEIAKAKQRYEDVKLLRVKTDTKGLPMYEIYVRRLGGNNGRDNHPEQPC